jgi:hypothetical protein
MASSRTANPKIKFEAMKSHYLFSLEMRSYKPGNKVRYQVVDKQGNPLTQYILSGEMNNFLTGLDIGLKIYEGSIDLTRIYAFSN